jgi:hypothetical protein
MAPLHRLEREREPVFRGLTPPAIIFHPLGISLNTVPAGWVKFFDRIYRILQDQQD